MNTFLKVSLATAALAGLAVGYILLQPTPVALDTSDASLRPTTRLVDQAPAISGIGPGERPWANQYDERGDLAYQFRAARYEPKDAGSVYVSSPTIQFFLTGGQKIALTGKDGMVYLPQGSAANTAKQLGLSTPAPGLPSRGTIKNVQISVYESPSATTPVLIATMDNVAFDNDTLRIATESFNDGARDIAADQVPVIVRGRDYDFDGRGLTIRINQRDRSLQSLETWGTRLIIKNPNALQGFSPATGSRASVSDDLPISDAFASTDPAATAAAALPNPVYRAVLKNQLKITQGKNTSATGDSLQIDFNPQSKDRRSVAADTAPTPTSSPAIESAVPIPAPPSPLAATPQEPYIVTWDGPLRVTGNAGDPQTPPGQAISTLMGAPGNPAILTQNGSVARAAMVLFETRGRIATLLGTDTQRVTLEDDKGQVVTTPHLKYDLVNRVVRMAGASTVRGTADLDDKGKPRTMLASWSKEAEFTFTKDAPAKADSTDKSGGGGGRIESARMAGDVYVEHPQLQLRSGQLTLGFDRQPVRSKDGKDALGGAELRSVLAEQNVQAVLVDPSSPNAPKSTLVGDRLTLSTTRPPPSPSEPDPKLYPNQIRSTGHVRASDGKQNLICNDLILELQPDAKTAAAASTGPVTARVKRLYATGDVKAVSEDGSIATADRMTVLDASGKPEIALEGDTASVRSADESAVLKAPLIRYTQADGLARIPEAGSLTGVQKPQKTGDRETPFSVKWDSSAVFDPTANRIDVAGNVQFQTIDRDGATTTARGNTLTAYLTDAANSPTPKPSPKSPTSTPPLLAKKQLKSLDLAGNVQLENLLFDPANGNALVRQITLLAEKVSFDQVGNPNSPTGATGSFSVPVPGRLLVVDRRAEPQSKDKVTDPLPSGRGTTAMRWKDSLRYDPNSRELTFLGNVLFVHQPLVVGVTPAGKPEDPYRLESQKMTAVLAPPPASASPRSEAQAAQVRQVSASGDVLFFGRGVLVRAAQLLYDPALQLLTARGGPRTPVEVDDPRGTGSGRFDSARFNLKTGLIEDLTNPSGDMGTTGLAVPGGHNAQKKK
jgi:hypothetical protein